MKNATLFASVLFGMFAFSFGMVAFASWIESLVPPEDIDLWFRANSGTAALVLIFISLGLLLFSKAMKY